MKSRVAAISLALVLAGGCANYYKVHDPTSGKTYYTSELQRLDNGAMTLKDARTGNTVNLQNSEIDDISKEEFESGRNEQSQPKPAAATPAPAKTEAPSAFQ